MTEQLIFPGKVDWSGENPGMYLKETADGPFVTLLSFFRVMISPFSVGHAVPREMAGRQITTAFLAFAESWIR